MLQFAYIDYLFFKQIIILNQKAEKIETFVKIKIRSVWLLGRQETLEKY